MNNDDIKLHYLELYKSLELLSKMANKDYLPAKLSDLVKRHGEVVKELKCYGKKD